MEIMAGITAVLLALILAAGIAVVVLVLDRLLQGPSKPAPRKMREKSASDYKMRPANVDEGDEEITIVGFAPMTLDDTVQADWADSEVNDAVELGQTHPIVHDAEAADEEPSASHALILVSAVGQTHKGMRRKNNQDSFTVLHDHNVFVVADGMGGYAGGEVASQLTVETIKKAFDTNEFRGNNPKDLQRDGAQLAASIQMANRAVWDKANLIPELEGMGTTVVAARFSPRRERVYIGHVGDSRCYRLRNDEFKAITADHNLAQMGVKGRNSHMLTRAVGIGPSVEVDLIMAVPKAGDSYLICSDGLNKMVTDAQIQEVLGSGLPAEKCVETLVNMANDAGGKDNITVIIIQVQSP